MPCRSTQFRCPSGLRNNPRLRCLDQSAICNGVANCMRGEDEANCTRRNCSSYQYVIIDEKRLSIHFTNVFALDFNVLMVFVYHVHMFVVSYFLENQLFFICYIFI
jgi:hypothetical protein